MASYNLFLYKEITVDNADGSSNVVRLEIYQKTSGGSGVVSMEIGRCLVGLSIDVGGNDNVLSPIIKSSCNIQLVDRPQNEWEPGKRCGNWEVFYTSDSTYYRVVIKVDGGVRWTGYITPDSYSEDLQPYPVVSITARDMIGHLSDFECDVKGDEYGMVTIDSFLSQAFAKSDIAMRLTQDDFDLAGRDEKGNEMRLNSANVNVTAFDGDTWYAALEKILSSFGLVMRYADINTIFVGTLEFWPKYMKTYGGESEFTFVNLSGVRTLDPAYREIIEDVEWEQGDIFKANYKLSDFTPKTFYYKNIRIEGADLEGWTLTDGIGVWDNNQLYKGKEVQYKNEAFYLHIYKDIPNYNVSNYIEKKFLINTSNKGYVKFGTQYILVGMGTEFVGIPQAILIMSVIIITQAGKKYWVKQKEDGTYDLSATADFVYVQYTSSYTEFEMEFPTKTSLYSESDSIKEIAIRFHGFQDDSMNPEYEYAPGFFLPIINLTVGAAGDLPPGGQKVRTVYNESNNVTLTRDSYFTQGGYMSPSVIVNSVYGAYPFLPLTGWYIEPITIGEKLLPFAAVVHKEILAYYSKPNNVLEGEFFAKTGAPKFNYIYLWGGKKHLLLSGSLNLLTGRMQNAVLREFLYYEDLWDN